MRGDPGEVTSTIIAPNTPTWQGLLDADRRLVLDWTQRPRIVLQPSASPTVPDISGRHAQPVPQRLVSDMMREAKREMRVRVWRDVGSLVGMALAALLVRDLP